MHPAIVRAMLGIARQGINNSHSVVFPGTSLPPPSSNYLHMLGSSVKPLMYQNVTAPLASSSRRVFLWGGGKLSQFLAFLVPVIDFVPPEMDSLS